MESVINAETRCMDNSDNSLLKTRDIVLDRISSKKSIGEPHLIIEEIESGYRTNLVIKININQTHFLIFNEV